VIAISYRREDSLPIAGRLYDRLSAEFGKKEVFMDFDSIPYGMDFRTHIRQTLARADVVVAVIGPSWAGPQSSSKRRIDDPKDFVRLEIAVTLERGIPLIPVLVNDTQMPAADALPMEIEALAFRNGIELDSGIDFHHHSDRLIAGIRELLKDVPNFAGAKPEGAERRHRTRNLALAGAGVAVILLACFGFVLMRNRSLSTQKENAPISIVPMLAPTSPTPTPAVSTSPITSPTAPSPNTPLSVALVTPPEAPSPNAPDVPSSGDEDKVRQLIREYYSAFSRHDTDAVVATFADIVDYQGEGLRDRQHIRVEAEAYARRWDTLAFTIGDISVSRTPEGDFAATFSFTYTVGTRGSTPVKGLSLNKWVLHKDSHGFLRIIFQRETIQSLRPSQMDKRKTKR
jgi:ketosteroid isomerase-like protein